MDKIGWTLTVTRKSDGATRQRTGEVDATREALWNLYLAYSMGSMGSDCNHDILFDPSLIDDEGLVNEPEVSAYVMDMCLADGTKIDLIDGDNEALFARYPD